MTEYHSVKVRLSDSRLDKSKSKGLSRLVMEYTAGDGVIKAGDGVHSWTGFLMMPHP